MNSLYWNDLNGHHFLHLYKSLHALSYFCVLGVSFIKIISFIWASSDSPAMNAVHLARKVTYLCNRKVFLMQTFKVLRARLCGKKFLWQPFTGHVDKVYK